MFDLTPPVIPECIARYRVVDMEQMERLGISKHRGRQSGIFQICKHDGPESRVNKHPSRFSG
jgi:hypothetical protein